MIFRRRPSAADEAVDGLCADAECVHEAEQVVRNAWAAHLVEQQERTDAALRVASRGCDVAYRQLAAARRGDDPRKTAAAHAALQTALKTLRICRDACEHTHRAYLREMDLLRRADAVRDLVRVLELSKTSAVAGPPGASAAAGSQSPAPTITRAGREGRAARPARGWFRRFLVFRTANRPAR